MGEDVNDFLGAHFPDKELRVLRYNFCNKSPFREMDSIDLAVTQIAASHARLKVQTSAGKEVAAACGQFLVAYPKSLRAPKMAPAVYDIHQDTVWVASTCISSAT